MGIAAVSIDALDSASNMVDALCKDKDIAAAEGGRAEGDPVTPIQ